MKYALGNMLNGGVMSRLDPSAKLYIDAVVAAGASVSSTQRNAINNFIVSGKSAGWWNGLYRLYLPIWGGADAPNIIDMVNRGNAILPASHTLTWASGYVTGSGINATGVFRDSATISSLGHSTSSSFFGALVAVSPTNACSAMGSDDSITNCDVELNPTAGNTFVGSRHFTASRVVAFVQTVYNGIFTTSRTSTSLLTYRRRNSSGVVNIGTNTAASGVVANNPMGYCGVRGLNSNNVASNGSFGAFFQGVGLSVANTDNFTAALQTLWQTCTGRTLP